jgi:hypothetical protein
MIFSSSVFSFLSVLLAFRHLPIFSELSGFSHEKNSFPPGQKFEGLSLITSIVRHLDFANHHIYYRFRIHRFDSLASPYLQ